MEDKKKRMSLTQEIIVVTLLTMVVGAFLGWPFYILGMLLIIAIYYDKRK